VTAPVEPLVIRTPAEMTAWSRAARARGERIAFVPTMGALHEGHVTLLREARRLGQRLVLSIFVNPTQFGPNEDLARYPRDLPGDLAKAASAGTDAAYVPEARDVYPPGYQTTVQVPELARGLCGPFRPGPLRRRRDGRVQAVQRRPARRRRVRREGLPAARDHPAHGGGPGHGDRGRRHPDRSRGGRAGDVLAQRVPVAGRARARAVAVAALFAARDAVGRPARATPRRSWRGARAALDVDRSTTSSWSTPQSSQRVTDRRARPCSPWPRSSAARG
jgi:cytidyltransferase-like protein